MKLFPKTSGTIVVFTVFLISSSSFAATIFSNASLKGTYGFLVTIHTANPNTSQFANIGIMNFDGAGNITLKQSSVKMGAVINSTDSGTYTVSSNGLSVISLSGGSRFAATLGSIVGGVATDVQLLQTDDTANEVVTGHAVLQSTTPRTYSLTDTNGTFFEQDSISSADTTVSQLYSIGVNKYDGKGHFSSSYIQMSGGQYFSSNATGTYTINSDGTGTATTIADGATINFISVANSKGGMAVVVNFPYNAIISGETHH